MSSPPIGSSFFHAGGSIVGASGAPVVANNASFARTGAGVYTATLTLGLDASECVALATFRGAALAADATPSIQHTSDTVKTIFITVGGVATDIDFDVIFFRMGVG